MENNPAAANSGAKASSVRDVRDALRSTPAYEALRENLVEMLQGDGGLGTEAGAKGVTSMLKSLLLSSKVGRHEANAVHCRYPPN